MANKVFACKRLADFMYFLLTPACPNGELLTESDILTDTDSSRDRTRMQQRICILYTLKVGCLEKEID